MPRNQVVVADNNNNASISGNFTAASLIRSGGTAAQILAANGSVITAGTNITISGGTISATSGTSLNGTGFVRMSGTTVSYITGTSSQFVKADGSLDSSTYVTGGPYLPLAGGTMTGAIIMSGTQQIRVAGFAGIEYYNGTAQWQGYIGTENNTGNLRYNSFNGAHTWYANSTQTMSLNSSGTLSVGRVVTTGLYGPSATGNIPIWQYDANNPGYGIVYFESSPDLLRIDVSGQALSGTPDFLIGPDYAQVNGNTIWHSGNLTNLNQLSNGPGYVTGGPYLPLSGGTLTGPITIGTTVGSTIWNDSGGTYIENTGNSTATRKIRLQAHNGSFTYAQFFVDGGNLQVSTTVSGNTNLLVDSSTTYLRWNGSDRFWTGSDGTRNSGWAYHTNNAAGLHWPNNNWHLVPSNASDFRFLSGSGTDVAIRFETAGGGVRGYVYAENDNTIGFLTSSRNWAFRTYSNGNALVYGYLTVNGAGTSSSIYMNDSDNGQREIHCNSDRIGFLTQAGNWGAWLYDSADWEAASSVRAPIFYDSANTAYYGDFASTSRMNNLILGSSYSPSYEGQLVLGHTSYNFNFNNGSWASSITAGILANCADEYEFAIHDSGNSVESLFIYQSSTGRILMGRDIGWGTTPIQAAADFRAPIFYDSENTGFYGDFASTSRMNIIRADKVRGDTNGDMGSSGWWAHDPYGYGWGQPHGSFRSLEVSSSGNFSTEPAMFRIHQWGSGAAEFWKPQGQTLFLRETPGGGGGWFNTFEVQGSLRSNNLLFPNGFQITQGGSNYGVFNSWVRLDGHYGFYAPSHNNAHFYPNNATYGAWRIAGSRNGYNGIEFDSSNGQVTLMVNTNSNVTGFHNNSYGWQFYWDNGTMYVGKNSYGGNNATVLDSSNFGSWAAPRAYITSSFVEFTIFGDQNTYYPVTIHNWNGSFSWQRYSIHRGYADTAPWNPIGTGSHQGGLTFCFDWAGDIAWGGNDKSIRVLEFDESYTTMVAGMQLAHCEGVVVWLRGGGAGGAYYRLHGPGGRAQGYTINMSSWTSCAGVTYSPRSYDGGTVNSEIRSRYPVRGSGSGDIFVNNNRVLNVSADPFAANMNQYVRTSDNVEFNQVSIRASLFVGTYQNSSDIYMTDGDEGTRRIHCNSHRVGFLSQAGGWGSYCNDDGSWQSDQAIYGPDVYTTGGWFRNHTNSNGIYWSATGWHLFPSNSADFRVHSGNSSESAFRMETNGTTRGYVYVNSSNEIGFLNSGRSWIFRMSNNGNAWLTGNLGINNQNPGAPLDILYSGSNVTSISAAHSGGISSGLVAQGLALSWSGYGASFAIVYKQGELSPSDMCHIYNVGGFYFKIFDGSSNRFHRWDDNGTVSINSSSQGSYTFNVTGDIYATADVIAFSDARVKDDVRTVENALDKVTKLRGVTYIKKDEDNKKRKMGVIAQEVLEVLPEVVHEDNNGYYGVSYGNIVGVLIEAIKEQQKQIDELKQELKNK